MVRKIVDLRIAELDFDQPVQPTNSSVLEFINSRTTVTSETEVFRNFRAKGTKRKNIRSILSYLESDGLIKRTTAKSFVSNFNLPRQSEVVITDARSDNNITGRAVRRNGVFGPIIRVLCPSKQASADNPIELNVDDRVFCTIKKKRHHWEATVMREFQPQATRQLTGAYSKKDSNGIVYPAKFKHRNPILLPQKHSKKAKHGDLVLIDYDVVGRIERKRVTNLRVIGRRDDPDFPITLGQVEHDLPANFPDEVNEQLTSLKPSTVEREDFTHKKLITIDPTDAKDHDDAVYAERNKEGWTVIVAIADVAAYVQSNSPVDIEARKRGNSTYFPNRVIPMLPFELSADLCSLKPHEVRPCILVEMKFNLSGEKLSHKFHRAEMKSAGNLNYRDAQNAIDGKPCSDIAKSLLQPVLKPLWNAFRSLKEAQTKRDPMSISSSECRFEFDDEGRVAIAETKETLEAHQLIEEFMIQANVSAAESLADCDFPVLYRIHDKPKSHKVEPFAECVRGMGLECKSTGKIHKAKFFNDLVRKSKGTDQTTALTEAILRCQSQAKYSVDNIGHFGLNLCEYVHFTSPIRRYSDLVIHRTLISALDLGQDGVSDTDRRKTSALAEHLSAAERQSVVAEREAIERYLALFYEGKERSKHSGYISGVVENGLFVKLTNTSATGFVPVHSLQGYHWRFNKRIPSLENRHKAKKYCFGQPVEVEIVDVDALTGKIDLKMRSVPVDFTPAPTKVKPEDKLPKLKKLSRRQKKRLQQKKQREGNL